MTRPRPTRWALLRRAPEKQARTVGIHSIWLRFPDPEVDREFRVQDNEAARPHVLLAGLPAGVLRGR